MTTNQLNEILKHPTNAEVIREAARSQNTRTAYNKSWKCYTDWCSNDGIDPLQASADDIVRFFVTMGHEGTTGKKPLSLNTLKIIRSALNDKWCRLGQPSPAAEKIVDELFRGLARIMGQNQRRVKALREYQVLAMLQLCGKRLHGLRDAAVLSLGFSAALRRSEICNLRVDDLVGECQEGLTLIVRRSKTDQTGLGQSIAVIQGQIIRPVEHLQRWLNASKIEDGYLFQTIMKGGVVSGLPIDAGDVALLVKRYAKRIGLDPKNYSGHSLRAGFVTSAASHQARIDKIMEVTRHKNAESVFKYIRDEDSFKDHAGSSFL
ncbi:MAG: site-specific integrase [Rhodobacteraceae bacterium]|nr:site-specific integrase [Paracoccaceae bacterium]